MSCSLVCAHQGPRALVLCKTQAPQQVISSIRRAGGGQDTGKCSYGVGSCNNQGWGACLAGWHLRFAPAWPGSICTGWPWAAALIDTSSMPLIAGLVYPLLVAVWTLTWMSRFGACRAHPGLLVARLILP